MGALGNKVENKEREETPWKSYVRPMSGGECSRGGPKLRAEKPEKDRQKAIEALYSVDEFDTKLLQFSIENPETSMRVRADYMNCSETKIRDRINKPGYQRAAREMIATTWDILEESQKMAALAVQGLLKDENPDIVYKACKLLLQPFVNKGQIEVRNVQQVIHEVKFGKSGELISSQEEVLAVENTTQLLLGEHYTEGQENDDERADASGEVAGTSSET